PPRVILHSLLRSVADTSAPLDLAHGFFAVISDAGIRADDLHLVYPSNTSDVGTNEKLIDSVCLFSIAELRSHSLPERYRGRAADLIRNDLLIVGLENKASMIPVDGAHCTRAGPLPAGIVRAGLTSY